MYYGVSVHYPSLVCPASGRGKLPIMLHNGHWLRPWIGPQCWGMSGDSLDSSSRKRLAQFSARADPFSPEDQDKSWICIRRRSCFCFRSDVCARWLSASWSRPLTSNLDSMSWLSCMAWMSRTSFSRRDASRTSLSAASLLVSCSFSAMSMGLTVVPACARFDMWWTPRRGTALRSGVTSTDLELNRSNSIT